jgi:hypothetical protein
MFVNQWIYSVNMFKFTSDLFYLLFWISIIFSVVIDEEWEALPIEDESMPTFGNSSYISKVQKFVIKVFNPRNKSRFKSNLNNIVIQY